MSTTAPVVLVTGSCGGIGSVTAALFGARGWRVALSDLDASGLETQRASLRAEGVDAEAFPCDVGDSAAVATLFESLQTRYGQLDAAFNNAGRGGGGVPLADTDDALWDDCMRINLTGTYHCMKHELRLMLAQGRGAIVNNCSILGLHGGPSAPYTATKHGVAGLTKSAALSYGAKNIRVNAVCPGLIEAGLGLKVMQRPAESVRELIAMHPMGRPGQASEVAAAVVWLCSAEASFVNGHMMAVDGGYGCR